jgi:inner membrane protease subunit 1
LVKRISRYPRLPNVPPPNLWYKALKDKYNASGDSFVAGVLKIAALFFLVHHTVFTYGFEISFPTGASMLPTIALSHDCVIISKLHRRGKDIQVGDTVAISHPMAHYAGTGTRLPGLIKRVIGMPGDFVTLKKGGYGDKDEDTEGLYDGDEGWVVQVPKGHFWIEGDNLNWSRDSRVLGALPLALIRGKVVARILPWGMRGWFRNPLKEIDEETVDDID